MKNPPTCLTALFRREPPRPGLFAIEKATVAYTLATTLLIVLLFGALRDPWQMLADRALILVVTLLLARLYRLAPTRFAAFVRVAVQLSLLSYWYPDTFEFNRLWPNQDHLFARAEQWLFGGQPALWFAERWPQMWVSEPLNLGYFFYYPMILIVVLWYLLRRFEGFERTGFVIAASFFIYYAVYIFLPVAGPQFYFPAIGPGQVEAGTFPPIGHYFDTNQELLPRPGYEHGLFYSLVEASQRVGERPTAAFPSSHVSLSTILMWLAWRGSRRLACVLLPFYLLLCTATVYIQAHYVIDVLAGLATAPVVYWAVSGLWRRLCRPKGGQAGQA